MRPKVSWYTQSTRKLPDRQFLLVKFVSVWWKNPRTGPIVWWKIQIFIYIKTLQSGKTKTLCGLVKCKNLPDRLSCEKYKLSHRLYTNGWYNLSCYCESRKAYDWWADHNFTFGHNFFTFLRGWNLIRELCNIPYAFGELSHVSNWIT